MFTLANTAWSATEADDELAGGDCCSAPVSFLFTNGALLLDVNVPARFNEELAELFGRRMGLMPGDFREMSGHLRANFNGWRQFFGSIRLLSSYR